MIALPKDALLYLFNAEADDVIIVLESLLDANKSAVLEDKIISHSLKDKVDTVSKIKEIIASNGLDTPDALKKTNRDIAQILIKRKKEHQSTASDAVISDDSALESMEVEIEPDKREDAETPDYADYLTDMEFQAYISISDKTINTSAIDGLSDKTRRYYMRMALGKMRVLKRLLKSSQ